MSCAAVSAAQFRYSFTVFTPTYNRMNTLSRVYESLKNQTFRDFEWLIVDDGSTDGTKSLVEAWQRKATFPIRYYRQEKHAGKMTAVNRGVREALGELFLIFDSDDACFPDALERFKYHWDAIPNKKRPHFSAVTALCVDEDGLLVGDEFPSDVTDSDSLEMTYRFKVQGEKWGFHRTEVLKKFPFPNLEGETVYPEGIVWNAIAREFRTRYVNEPLRIYFMRDKDYGRRRWWGSMKRARGIMLRHETILNYDIDWFKYAPGKFLRSAVHYSRFAMHSGIGLTEQVSKLSNPLAKAIWLLAVPIGWLAYIRDRWRIMHAGAATNNSD